MKKRLLRAFVLTSLVALTLAAVSLRDDHTRAEAAVSKMQYSLGCSPNGGSTVAFYWYGTSPSAKQVWIDVSTTLGYWDPGTYTSTGPFGANEGYYEWRGLSSGTTYYIRFNQLLPSGYWDPSETFYLTTEACGR
jgi:hypothetical protein